MEQRVLAVMSVVFNLKADQIPENAAPGVLKQWDSLKHMNLVLALEDEFGFRFADDELTDLLSLKLVLKIVSDKQGMKP
jgi:acyl carrier protein